MSPAPRVVTEHGTGQLPHLASLGGPLSQWLQVGRAAVYVDVEYARHPAILRAVRDAEIAIEAALAEARVAE